MAELIKQPSAEADILSRVDSVERGGKDEISSRLAMELADVAIRHLPETFKDPASDDLQKFPHTALITRVLEPEIWERDPPGALIAVMRRAIGELPSDELVPGCAISWQRMALILFGYVKLPRRRDGNKAISYKKDYVRRARAESNYHGSAFPRVTRKVRQRIAEILVTLDPDPGTRSTVSADDPGDADNQPEVPTRAITGAAESGGRDHKTEPSEPPYVPRPVIEAKLRELHAQGEKLIVLVGQPGMGKTWLAREAARHIAGKGISLIQVFEKKPHVPDLIYALRANGIDFASDAPPVEYLALLLSADQAPPVVIIDNLESADELRILLPSQLRSTILATARVTGAAPHPQATFVAVGKMAQAESETLVRHYAPSLEAAAIERLVRELHGYPLILRHASVLLERGGITISDLMQSLRSTSATVTTVGRMRTEDGARLAVVLHRVVELLREEDDLAYELLRLLAFVQFHASVSYQFLSAYAREVEHGCTRLRTGQAVQALAGFALIDQTDRDVRMHPLTVSIHGLSCDVTPLRLWGARGCR